MFRSTVLVAIFVAVCLGHFTEKVGTFRRGVTVVDGIPHADLPILSAAEIVGHGFNALTTQHGPKSGLLPVVGFTYQFGQTWSSPTGETYKVPDQLTLSEQPDSSLKIVEQMSDTYESTFTLYTSQFHFSAGVSFANAFGASIGYSHELQRCHKEMSNHSTYSSYSHYWASYFQLVAPPAYVLGEYPTPGFRLALMGLPSTIKTAADSSRYNQFVTVYGTHYVCIGLFGGYVHQMSFLDKKVASQYSNSQVATQFNLEFHYKLYKLSGGGFHNRSDIHQANWFTQNARTYDFWSGGNVTLQNHDTVDEWRESIPNNAALLNSTLCPLSDLITTDATKQKTFSDYITTYLSKK